eukprot:jgi/Botrbrau1/2963/Bobra.0026s0031.1
MAVTSMIASMVAGSSSGAPIRLLARILTTESASDVVKQTEPSVLVAPPDTLASTWVTPDAKLLPRRESRRRGAPKTAKCKSCHRDSVTVTYCPPGERLDPATVPFPRKNTFWEEWIALLVMSALFMLPFICLACLALAPLATLYGCTHRFLYQQHTALTTFCLFFSTFVWTCFLICCGLGDGQVQMWFRHHYVFDCVRRYYQLRCIAPPLPYIDQKKRYLLAQFPHAVFPIAVWLNAATVGLPASGFPHPMRAAIADVLLKLPLFKLIFQWMGCVSAEKEALLKLLKRESLGIIPEGVAGVTEGASPEIERLYINCRKGFVRVAIQAGAGIVPIYHLGNSQLMHFYGLRRTSRKARAALGWFAGRWFLPIPKRYPIVSLVGGPIDVVQCDNPSQEYVDEIHAKVLKTLVDNYNLHRHLLPGWEHRPLILA